MNPGDRLDDGDSVYRAVAHAHYKHLERSDMEGIKLASLSFDPPDESHDTYNLSVLCSDLIEAPECVCAFRSSPETHGLIEATVSDVHTTDKFEVIYTPNDPEDSWSEIEKKAARAHSSICFSGYTDHGEPRKPSSAERKHLQDCFDWVYRPPAKYSSRWNEDDPARAGPAAAP